MRIRHVGRKIVDGLALFFSLDPEQRVTTLLVTIVGLVTLNTFGAALYDLPEHWSTLMARRWSDVPASLWLGLIPFPILFLIYIAWSLRRPSRRQSIENTVLAAGQPEASSGLIILLSTFSVFSPKLNDGLRALRNSRIESKGIDPRAWPEWELRHQLARGPDFDRALIDQLLRASNMQVALRAIAAHHQAGRLEHLWVLATPDVEGTDRSGSHALVGLFDDILQYRFDSSIKVHDWREDERLLISPFNVADAAATVDWVFRRDGPRYGLDEGEICADITGGTVTMTAGVVLACALQGRRMQYTAANSDPMHGLPLDQPTAYQIELDESQIRRRLFARWAQE